MSFEVYLRRHTHHYKIMNTDKYNSPLILLKLLAFLSTYYYLHREHLFGII